MEQNKTKSRKHMWAYIVFGIIYFFAVSIAVIVAWSRREFDVDLKQLIYTATAPLVGTDSGVFENALKGCLPPIVFFMLLGGAAVWGVTRINREARFSIKLKSQALNFNARETAKKGLALLSCLVLAGSLAYTEASYGVFNYIKMQSNKTKIYDEYYVNPLSVDITAENGKGKNLIYIYMESMENTYSQVDLGAGERVNLIPELTSLAENNISFSNSTGLGGYHPFTGATWTMGSLFSSSAGIPFSFPVEQNSMGRQYATFAAGTVALGDILEQKGYVQEFLCGSDASYAGRRSFYEQHGNYEIFDVYTARERGYIPEDYFTWWGFEDKYLYEIAKDEITRLAAGDKPFNLTMLTVDTHFPEGYTCSLCGDAYIEAAANVVSCADRQLSEFISWCQAQDFYKDTVIVIVGDHPRMDLVLVNGTEYYTRTLYNCIIGSAAAAPQNIKNREFTAMDMFPTVLSSMGFKIEGERLGLGTNMLSGRRTLLEELGREYLTDELMKNSDYYLNNFN